MDVSEATKWQDRRQRFVQAGPPGSLCNQGRSWVLPTWDWFPQELDGDAGGGTFHMVPQARRDTQAPVPSCLPTLPPVLVCLLASLMTGTCGKTPSLRSHLCARCC